MNCPECGSEMELADKPWLDTPWWADECYQCQYDHTWVVVHYEKVVK